ncbi:hypothetical protein N7G274_009240 [Stereocaulon virgatum]|uniref:NACHT-NTPase and P-loop NTPases N-terminal domain-containing protein n=1 Tax=Stereocaulon virgatum TaxID=373712 RepID=A0ABR3ZXV5_9LECA
MAEAFVIVELVAAMFPFVAHVPETFRAIKTELPFLVDILRRTKRQAEKGDISKNTQQALKPAVESCVEQVEVLDAILAKVLSATSDLSWDRWMKVFTSVRNGKNIDKVVVSLRNYIQILTYHQATEFAVSKEYLDTVTGDVKQHYGGTSTSGSIEATGETAERVDVGEGAVAGNNPVQRSSDSSSITSDTDSETADVTISRFEMEWKPWMSVADRVASLLTSIEVVATSANLWSAFIIDRDDKVRTTSWASGELSRDW